MRAVVDHMGIILFIIIFFLLFHFIVMISLVVPKTFFFQTCKVDFGTQTNTVGRILKKKISIKGHDMSISCL